MSTHTVDNDPWRQAALLMQPALLRLIDQLRKQLERSPWKGTYETQEIWPDGTMPQEKEKSEPPQILYLLHLSLGNQQVQVNLWELCYQICFADYTPQLAYSGINDFQVGDVQVDLDLLDGQGEIDWHRLDEKAQSVVKQVFDALPA
jgi:hypothetical protein